MQVIYTHTHEAMQAVCKLLADDCGGKMMTGRGTWTNDANNPFCVVVPADCETINHSDQWLAAVVHWPSKADDAGRTARQS